MARAIWDFLERVVGRREPRFLNVVIVFRGDHHDVGVFGFRHLCFKVLNASKKWNNTEREREMQSLMIEIRWAGGCVLVNGSLLWKKWNSRGERGVEPNGHILPGCRIWPLESGPTSRGYGDLPMHCCGVQFRNQRLTGFWISEARPWAWPEPEQNLSAIWLMNVLPKFGGNKELCVIIFFR